MIASSPLDPGFRFLTDGDAPGLLHAAVLRSPHPHALIRSIDTSAARAVAGVAAVVTAADVPGKNRFGIRIADQPILCADRVRTIGDPVAAVAATSPAAARRAVAAIRVTYEQLPTVASPEEALAPGAPQLHDGGNLLHRTYYARADVEAALAASAHVVRGIYESGHQVHHFIEPEGAVAIPAEGGLTVYAPGHWAEVERSEIAAMLGLDTTRVRVVSSPVGGSFGGKDALHAQPIAALLAHVTGRPVRSIWRREESFAVGVKRHPFRTTVVAGADREGRLTALRVDMTADTGAYAQHGPEVLDTAHENAQGPYAWPAVELVGRLVYTNNGISGAMRGFGAVQVQTAVEQHVDRLASACGLDPLEFRARNLRPPTAAGQLGQVLAAPSHAAAALARLNRPSARHRSDRFIVGKGVALVEKNEGFARGGPNAGSCAFAFTAAGRIEVRCGFSDLGQGLGAALRAAAVRFVGCGPEDIDVVLGDTALTPDTGPISASRGAGVVWRALRAAAPAFRDRLLAGAADRVGWAEQEFRIGPGGLHRTGPGTNTPILPFADVGIAPFETTGRAEAIETSTGEGAVHALFSACGAEATVAVDVATGRVHVRSLRLVPVTGPILDDAALHGQMAGGASMAAGFVTSERLRTADGRFLASNFDGYFAPTIADAFETVVDPVDDIPADAAGPRGVGEIAVNAAAPAIANAVHAATGFVCAVLPVDPEAMLAHLEAKGWT